MENVKKDLCAFWDLCKASAEQLKMFIVPVVIYIILSGFLGNFPIIGGIFNFFGSIVFTVLLVYIYRVKVKGLKFDPSRLFISIFVCLGIVLIEYLIKSLFLGIGTASALTTLSVKTGIIFVLITWIIGYVFDLIIFLFFPSYVLTELPVGHVFEFMKHLLKKAWEKKGAFISIIIIVWLLKGILLNLKQAMLILISVSPLSATIIAIILSIIVILFTTLITITTWNLIYSVYEGYTPTGEDIFEKATQKAEALANKVSAKKEEVEEKVEDKTEEVKEKVEDTVESLKEEAEDLKDDEEK